jgi:hypothetical protein
MPISASKRTVGAPASALNRSGKLDVAVVLLGRFMLPAGVTHFLGFADQRAPILRSFRPSHIQPGKACWINGCRCDLRIDFSGIGRPNCRMAPRFVFQARAQSRPVGRFPSPTAPPFPYVQGAVDRPAHLVGTYR